MQGDPHTQHPSRVVATRLTFLSTFTSLGLAYLCNVIYLTYELNLLFFFPSVFGALAEKEGAGHASKALTPSLLVWTSRFQCPPLSGLSFLLCFPTGLIVFQAHISFPRSGFSDWASGAFTYGPNSYMGVGGPLVSFKSPCRVSVKHYSITFVVEIQ